MQLTDSISQISVRGELKKYVNKSGTNVGTDWRARSVSGYNYLAGGEAIISRQVAIVFY